MPEETTQNAASTQDAVDEALGLRIKELAARFGGLIPPDRNATEVILSKIYASVDALVDALKEARHG